MLSDGVGYYPDDAPAYVEAFEQALRDRSHFRQRLRSRLPKGNGAG